MSEFNTLNCANCPFGTNTDGRICRTAVVPALALLIRDGVIDKHGIGNGPEDLVHSLLGLAPVSRAAHMACEAVLSVKLETEVEVEGQMVA